MKRKSTIERIIDALMINPAVTNHELVEVLGVSAVQTVNAAFFRMYKRFGLSGQSSYGMRILLVLAILGIATPERRQIMREMMALYDRADKDGKAQGAVGGMDVVIRRNADTP